MYKASFSPEETPHKEILYNDSHAGKITSLNLYSGRDWYHSHTDETDTWTKLLHFPQKAKNFRTHEI